MSDAATYSDSVVHNPRAGSEQYHARADPIHPGALHADMPTLYTMADQRPILHVPRPPHLSPPQESFQAITFRTHGWPGVRVKDILKETVVVDAADDHMFEDHGWRTTVIHLEWPGYDSTAMHARINVRPNGGYMTRQEFAREICALLYKFHKIATDERHPLNTTDRGGRWELTRGPNGIRVTDIVLLSVHYYRTFWVPEFYGILG